MAGLEFQDELKVFNEKQLAFLRNVIEKRGFTNGEVLVESVGKKGDNYIASVKRITVKSNNGELFKMIAKVAPTVEAIRVAVSIGMLFLNEIHMYSEILPKFADLLQTENVPQNQRFRMPACYGYLSDAPNEIILLEDLQESNFKMLDRFQPLSNENIKLVLKDLAIFHSLSYVMQERDHEDFQSLKKNQPSVWEMMKESQAMKLMMKDFETDALDAMESEKYKKILRGNIGNFIDIASKIHKHSFESKHSVIQQGDCWTNNIMFRVEEGRSVESCMIDYQLSRIASPVADILYLIFNCTDHDTRSKNYNDWLAFYHSELENSLNNFGLKANRIYPRDQMDADLRRYGKLALALSVVFANNLCRDSNEVLEIKGVETENDESEEFRVKNMREETRLRFRKRVEDCIESALEFGLVTP